MAGHSDRRQSLSDEEKMGLLEETAASDVDSDAGTFSIPRRFRVRQWAPIFTTPFIYLRNVYWKALAVRFIIFLVPSFLQGRHAREQIRPAKLYPTAYLDGMRGLAALFVFFCHYSYQAFKIGQSWGAGDENYYILKLPFLRLFYQGPAAVCVFFVISGYALCYRPLKLARNNNLGDFSSTMGSLVFRRWFRLFIPPMISTLMILCLARMGAYELTREFATDPAYHRNVMEQHMERWDDGYAQFWDWLWNMFGFIHVWDWEPHAARIGTFI